MTRPDPRAAAVAAVGFAALIAGAFAGEPAAAALGCALLAPLVVAAAGPPPASLVARFAVDRLRLLEGEEATGELTVEAAAAAGWVELELPAVPGVRVGAGAQRSVVSLRPGERRVLSYRLRFERWGVHRVGAAAATSTDAIGLRTAQAHAAAHTVRVFPSRERIVHLLPPASTRAVSGSQLSRRKGEGFEFADLRPYAVGDSMRRINWRQSARRGSLVVTERAREESADVVLFLDAYAEARDDDGGTLDDVVRAAAALARAHLRRHDRVGLVSFAGELQWLRPASGQRHLYRIAETLLESEIGRSLRWQRADVIPRRILPPHALVIALTPLLDERTNRALLDLRARGYDLAIVELDPMTYLARLRAVVGDEAWRLWLGWREAIRATFERRGVAVTTWERGRPLAPVLEEALRARRSPHARSA